MVQKIKTIKALRNINPKPLTILNFLMPAWLNRKTGLPGSSVDRVQKQA